MPASLPMPVLLTIFVMALILFGPVMTGPRRPRRPF
jgi:hypothetical protein